MSLLLAAEPKDPEGHVSSFTRNSYSMNLTTGGPVLVLRVLAVALSLAFVGSVTSSLAVLLLPALVLGGEAALKRRLWP